MTGVIYASHYLFLLCSSSIQKNKVFMVQTLKLPLVFDCNVGNPLCQGIFLGHHFPILKSKNKLYQPAEQLI